MNDLILLKHFKKYMSSQPFFIWNSYNEESEEDFSVDNFWSVVIEEKELVSFSEIAARTTSLVDKWLRDKFIKEYETLFFKGDSDTVIKESFEAIGSGKMLINPSFEFNGAIAKPFAYDDESKSLIIINYSKKTKRKLLLDIYWFHSIMVKNDIVINNVYIYLPVDKVNYKKNEIDLRRISKCHLTSSGDVPFAVNKKGFEKDDEIMVFLSQPILKVRGKEDIHFEDIERIIEKIDNARNIKDANINELWKDFSSFGTNKEKQILLKKLGFPYPEFNGKIITSKQILEWAIDKSDISIQSHALNSILNIDSANVIREDIYEMNMIDEAERVVWYDFEGMSSPVSPVNYVYPYQQIIFQCSIIITENDKEIHLDNAIYDPASLSLDNLYEIIKKVYAGKADAYVVYNKGYEIPRMREIVFSLKLDHHPKAKEAEEMLNHIEINTVDLMNIFKMTSNKMLPPIILNDQDAKASIKNIEKHITKNNISLPRPIKEYKNLEIKNGGMAMEAAINRTLGITGDVEWNHLVEKLKEYCENDVRAMIMVYDFVKKLIKEKK